MNAIEMVERKKKLAAELTSALCTLANIVEDWNDAQEEPGERGRGNSAIGLIVFEDGSGCIVEFGYPTIDNDMFSNGSVVHDFDTPEQAEPIFFENISQRSLYD